MADVSPAAPGILAGPRSARRQVTFRGGGFLTAPRPLYSWLAFGALFATWQAAAAAGWITPVFLPAPVAILKTLWNLTVSGALWQHLAASGVRIGSGWIIGTALGLVAGVAMGLFSGLRAVGMPVVSAVYPIPKIALLPLLVLWMGIGESPKVAMIAAGVFFPTIIATCSGVDAVPRSLIRMGQSFNMPAVSIVWKIILPAALPAVLAGFRISVASALLLVVAAEMIGAQFGVGAFLLTAGNLMRSDDLMAGVVVLSALGLAFGALVSVIEKKFLGWR